MSRYSLQGSSLLIDVTDHIATVTLNRPRQHNALSRELRDNLGIALEAMQADADVRVIIFTGAGDRAFSAGADLKELESDPLRPEEVGVDCRVMQAFAHLTKPTIAAVNGYAVAGGFELVTNCDIIVAASNARFADTHARVGVVPAWGLSQYLPALVGPVRARYLAFTGNYLDAETAKAWGLVLDVLPADQLLPFCQGIARDILSADQATLTDIHAAMRTGIHRTLEEGLAAEAKLVKAGLARFDAGSFGGRRAQVMSRGKRQLES